MSKEKPYQPSEEEIAKIEKERTLSDANFLKGGAEYVIDKGERKNLIATEQQKNKIKFENISLEKIKTLGLSEFVGKKLSNVEKHVLDTYGPTYNIPGGEYVDYIIENQDKIHSTLFKDGNRYYCFGDRNGVWTSYIIYEQGKLMKDVSSDTSTWGSNRRIVFIER